MSSSSLRGRGPVGDDPAQRAGAAVAVGVREHVGELADVDVACGLGLARGAAQLPGAHDRGEIQQRPRRRRDEHPVAAHDVAAVDGARPVDSQAGDPALGARDGDLRAAPIPAHKAPVRRGRVVAQDRAATAREHGGDERCGRRQRVVPDGVDAAVHAVQAPAADPPRDRSAVEPEGGELADGDDPMLLARDRDHAHVGACVIPGSETEGGMTHARGHAAIVRDRGLRNHTRS
jgi:hypothetical protein